MRTKKRGQVKMMETIMVLVVFVFLFGLVMIFYARFQVTEIDRISKQVEEQRAASLLNKIISMPELRCSLSFGSASEINCLDTYKLFAFTDLRERFASEFTGLSNVTIVKDYPIPNDNRECNVADLENCEYWQLFDTGLQSRISFDTFVTLCTPKSAGFECEIGRLIVSVKKR